MGGATHARARHFIFPHSVSCLQQYSVSSMAPPEQGIREAQRPGSDRSFLTTQLPALDALPTRNLLSNIQCCDIYRSCTCYPEAAAKVEVPTACCGACSHFHHANSLQGLSCAGDSLSQ